MSQNKFKRMRHGKRKKQPQKTRKEQPSYCMKDVVVNLRARENVNPAIEDLFEKKYFTKYPHGKKPYGFETGISMEEWKADCKKLGNECERLMVDELERLSKLIDDYWINKPETQSLLDKPLPILIIYRIKEYSATTYIMNVKEELIEFCNQ